MKPRFCLFLIALLCSSVCVLPSRAQTGTTLSTNTVVFNLSSFVSNPANVTSVSLTPLYWPVAGGIFYPSDPVTHGRASYPELTNGFTRFTNLVCGVPMKVAISTTYAVYTTNIFIPTQSGLTTNADGSITAGLFVGTYSLPPVVGFSYASLAGFGVTYGGVVTNDARAVNLTNVANQFVGTFTGSEVMSNSIVTNLTATTISPGPTGGISINAGSGNVSAATTSIGVDNVGTLNASSIASTPVPAANLTGTATINTIGLDSFATNSLSASSILLGARTTAFVSGSNSLGAELTVTNLNAAGWSGVTAQTDKGSFNTNYVGVYINNSGYVPGAGIIGSTNDTSLESASGNFFLDVVGGGNSWFWTTQPTPTSTVTTNAIFNSSGITLNTGQFNGNGGGLTNLNAGNFAGPYPFTNSYEILINTNGSFYANGQFFPNVGTTSGGIMEAFTNGVQALTGGATNNKLGLANCIWMKFAAGYHFFSTQVILSNTFNVDLVFEGKGLKSTKLVYTGNQTGIATIETIASSVNSGASLNHPQFIMIRDLGFSAINNTTNWLVSIGDPSNAGNPNNSGLDAAIIERVNFSGWWVMTNTQNGAELTAAGSGTQPPPGLIGLKIQSTQEHGITINNVYCGGLAVGMDLICDHLYVRDVAAGNVGSGQGGTNLWTWSSSPYGLGALIIDRHQIEAAYENIHCYTAPIGIAFLPQPGGSFTSPATVSGLETEISPIGIGCEYSETPTIFNPNMSGIYQDCYIITGPDSGALVSSNRYTISSTVNPYSISYGGNTYNGDNSQPYYYVRIGGTNQIEAWNDQHTFLLNPAGNGRGFTNMIMQGPTNATAPANTSIIRAWANFTNASGGVFKLPLYQ